MSAREDVSMPVSISMMLTLLLSMTRTLMSQTHLSMGLLRFSMNLSGSWTTIYASCMISVLLVMPEPLSVQALL
jgi:hypothetical protein